MKLVNFKDFAGLPAGTLFSYYEPAIFTGLWSKGKTIISDGQYGMPVGPIDYFQRSLLPSISGDLHDPIIAGVTERWGEYEYTQLYCIYEEQDLDVLRKLVEGARVP